MATSPNGLPQLQGTLADPAAAALHISVRLHTAAGIPIMAGHAQVTAGARTFVVASLVPLGIEGYQHYTDEQRAAVARRVWSRCAYATLQVRPAAALGDS